MIVGDGDPAFGTARFARAANQPVTRVPTLAREGRAGRREADHRPGARRRLDLRPQAGRRPRPEPALGPLVQRRLRRDGQLRAARPSWSPRGRSRTRCAKRGVEVGGRVGHVNLPDSALDRKPLAQAASPSVAGADRGDQRALEQLLRGDAAQAARRRRTARAARGSPAPTTSSASRTRSAPTSRPSTAPGSRAATRSRRTRSSSCSWRWPATRPDGPAFRDSLPIAGREGTVADRMRGTAAEGNCATKTGTLDGVSALSGYCKAARAHDRVLGPQQPVDINAAHNAQDRIAAAIARYRP